MNVHKGMALEFQFKCISCIVCSLWSNDIWETVRLRCAFGNDLDNGALCGPAMAIASVAAISAAVSPLWVESGDVSAAVLSTGASTSFIIRSFYALRRWRRSYIVVIFSVHTSILVNATPPKFLIGSSPNLVNIITIMGRCA